MKFRTEVHIADFEEKINPEDKVFSIGSCFSSEMSELLQAGQIQTLNNPFGTIFNPHSLSVAVQKLHDAYIYAEEDLVTYGSEVISLDHHSQFNSAYAHQTLDKININIVAGNQFLQETKWVIITYGSSFIYYFHPKERLVANCHKIPGKFFEKRMLSANEIENAVSETILNLKDICRDDVQILFTVSPVRHTKDGMTENTLSKAKLIAALHEVIPQFENCHYLPVYEILMDDLRDYRFYKDDLIHPNSQAVNYIFEKFGNAFFSDETMDFVEENFSIAKALQHRTKDASNPKYHQFLENLKGRIALQQTRVKHNIFEDQKHF